MHNNYEVYFIYVICLNVQFSWFIMYKLLETDLVTVTMVFALMSTQTYILDADLILNCNILKVFGLKGLSSTAHYC